MSINFHYLNASKRLLPYQELLQRAAHEAANKVESKIKLADIDVTIADAEHLAVSETGVGGMTHSANLIEIYIDPTHKGLVDSLGREIRSTLTHELHHAARRLVFGYEPSLLGACVSEGLADHFDVEVNGGSPKPWCHSVSGDALLKLIDSALPVFQDEFDHNEWFWGTKDKPKWAAYAIGFELVKRYIEKTGKKASELVSTEAELFIHGTA